MYTVQCCVMQNLRNLSRMLACLDRFGKELFLEVVEGQVSLRTLNQAQSAFVVFTLREDFFSEFIIEPNASASVKLHLKNVVSIFRSVQHVEKLWIQLDCSGDESQNHMRVLHECTNGLRKKFDLAFEEVTSMNAVYSKEGCPHHICVDPGTLLSCLTNFPQGLAEATLVCQPDAVLLKNDPDAVGLEDMKDGCLRTEMRLLAADLHDYKLGPEKPQGLHVTFSLREFKAILQLVKDLEHRCIIFIEDVGQPLILSSEPREDLPQTFVMECVLATLVEAADLNDDLDGVFDDEYSGPQAQEPPQSDTRAGGSQPWMMPATGSAAPPPVGSSPWSGGQVPGGIGSGAHGLEGAGAGAGTGCNDCAHTIDSFASSVPPREGAGSVCGSQAADKPARPDCATPHLPPMGASANAAAAYSASLDSGFAGAAQALGDERCRRDDAAWQASRNRPSSPQQRVPGQAAVYGVLPERDAQSESEEDEDAVPGTPPYAVPAKRPYDGIGFYD
mmetsp:Transcript_39755/g.84719  ORF Transcript_39755/g.84719 Transcript_39755/m.84719 type:complete len:503 (-) Transcript_39755:240-1748(-)